MLFLIEKSNLLLSKKCTLTIDVSNKLHINYINQKVKISELIPELIRIANEMIVRAEEVGSKSGIDMSKKLKDKVNAWYISLMHDMNQIKNNPTRVTEPVTPPRHIYKSHGYHSFFVG